MIKAIILAAGRSRRMGTPKMQMKIAGQTFLQHISGCLQRNGIRHITVVLGFNAERMTAEMPPELDYAVNKNFDNGQFSSLQCGLRRVLPDCEAALVCLVDQPHIQDEWVNKITAAFRQTKGDIFVPAFRGKSGHPVLYSASVFPKIMAMAPTQTARDLRSRPNIKTRQVPLDDPGILQDADYPHDIIKIKKYFQ